MDTEDIRTAYVEAKRFIKYVDDAEEVGGVERPYSHPVEAGLIKAQSLILTKALSGMRNPYKCQHSCVQKRIREYDKNKKGKTLC